MRTFAQKQDQSKEQQPSSLDRSNTPKPEPIHNTHLILQLQRTVGNQAVQRLLRANAVAGATNAAAVKTEEPSPRALMLLEMFTKNRPRFKKFSSSEYEFRERKDKDASRESIRVKEGEIYWTLEFVTNNKTGFIYVRQSQDETRIVNYFQSIQAEKASSDAASQKISDKEATSDKEDKPVAKAPPKEAAGNDEKEPPKKTSPSINQQASKENPKAESHYKIGKTHIPGGFFIGVLDQTWLPGKNHQGNPAQQGDMAGNLEESLVKFVQRIKASGTLPKELKISVIIYNDSGGPAPGYRYGAENLGFNIKKFLEARLSKSIKITETHGVVDTSKASAAEHWVTITPVY